MGVFGSLRLQAHPTRRVGFVSLEEVVSDLFARCLRSSLNKGIT